MYPSIITIAVVFSFLFCQQVKSSRESFLQGQAVPNDHFDDDLLSKFFVDYRNTHLDNFEFRHIVVISEETNGLQQVKTLLDGYPYTICKSKNETCAGNNHWLRETSFVVIFLEELTEAKIKTEGFPLYTNSKFLIVSDGTLQFQKARFLYHRIIQTYVPYAAFVYRVKGVVELYNIHFTTQCFIGTRLLVHWKPGVTLPKIDIWADILGDLNRCPIRVTSYGAAPNMYVPIHKNGSCTIVKGREGFLVLAIATKLNFTLKFQCPSLRDVEQHFRRTLIISDVLVKKADFGIGGITPTAQLKKKSEFSLPYAKECVTWGVPRIIKWSNNIVWIEFSWEVWGFVCLIFIFSCVIGYVISSTSNQTHRGFVAILLDAIAIHLGMSIVHLASSARARLFFLIYLYYGILITTAYISSLATILTTDEGTSMITDIVGIIAANLTVGISPFDYDLLREQATTNKSIYILLERFVIKENNHDLVIRLLRGNYGYLGPRSTLIYYRQLIIRYHKSISFDVFDSDRCVIDHYPAIIFSRFSMLREPINTIIRYLTESGILDFWDPKEFNTDKILRLRVMEDFYQNRGTKKFFSIFIFYSACIVLCLVTFFVELLVAG